MSMKSRVFWKKNSPSESFYSFFLKFQKFWNTFEFQAKMLNNAQKFFVWKKSLRKNFFKSRKWYSVTEKWNFLV